MYKGIGAVLLASILVLSLLPVGLQPAEGVPEGRSLTYVIEVEESGNATVVLVFEAGDGSSFYTFLPRFENWSYTVWSGSLVKVDVKNSSAYFYYNVTFSYEPGPEGLFGLNISYHFPYASLHIGKRGWFMTPLLGSPPDVEVEVVVRDELVDEVFSVTVNGVEVRPERRGSRFRVRVPGEAVAAGGRVTMDYTLSKQVEAVAFEENVDSSTVRILAAPYYKYFASKIIGIVREAKPLMEEVFGPLRELVEFEFFLPERVNIYTYGYVIGEDVNAGGKGPIHLNLALIRFKEGFLETTVVHEYVHLALGALGVPASRELRWFHEGVAEYVSLEVCRRVGIDVADIQGLLLNASEVFRSGLMKPGFIQEWTPRGNEAAYYAASYYVISTLAERYGGLEFLKRVMEEIKARNGIGSNEELVEVLSNAAGEDLSNLFTEWGFNLGEIEIKVRVGRPRIVVVLAASILALVAALSLYVILRGRGKARRCPYCYAVLPKEADYCPYCGALIGVEEPSQSPP